MLKAIIFDFDGVIADTELDRFKYLQKELKKYDYSLKQANFPKIFGKKIFSVLKELFPKMPEILIEKIAQKRRKQLKTKITEFMPISGLKTFLSDLNDKYAIAITTGSTREVVSRFLNHHGLNHYFHILICGDDFKSSKPDPEGFRLTIKKLQLTSSDVIIIEDSEAGIAAAKKLKCTVFGLQNKFNFEQIKNADKVFQNYASMRKYFKSLT
jgi:beta-phosphoglucomutase